MVPAPVPVVLPVASLGELVHVLNLVTCLSDGCVKLLVLYYRTTVVFTKLRKVRFTNPVLYAAAAAWRAAVALFVRPYGGAKPIFRQAYWHTSTQPIAGSTLRD